jgi:hypothetical protein
MEILCFVVLLPLSARQPDVQHMDAAIEPDARACQSVNDDLQSTYPFK